ncbi:DUF3168 domain-containing protein [Brevundimonas faecalis]|uniref:DUF3168 domain-containing protein n=1 Tax=Brevundimonas faecalis TaxID=947378 RepID=UPI0036201856
MEEAISNLLLGNATVAGMVGDRVNWAARPGVDLPAITLHRITGQRDATMSGRTGLVRSTVQIDIWGATYSQAKKLARAVVPALPQTPGATLQGVFINSESDSFEGEDPTPLYRTRIDISVWHQEI